jgi:hypothetical protein
MILSDIPVANISPAPQAEGLETHSSLSEDLRCPNECNVHSLLGDNGRIAQLRPVTSQTTTVTNRTTEDTIRQSMEINNFINPPPGPGFIGMDAHPLKRLFKLISARAKFQVITRGVLFGTTVDYSVSKVSCGGAYGETGRAYSHISEEPRILFIADSNAAPDTGYRAWQ